MRAKTIALIVFFLLLFIVHIQNTQVVTLHFLFWELSMSQIILMPLLILFGFGLGFIVAKFVPRRPRSAPTAMQSPDSFERDRHA